MSRSRRITVVRPVGRWLAVAMVILLVGTRLPLPVGWTSTPEKDRSQLFPCMNRPCGCRSASTCWKQCCCFTNAQKVAWAKANNVAVPKDVVVAAGNETREQPVGKTLANHKPGCRDSDCNGGSCCKQKCCSKETTPVSRATGSNSPTTGSNNSSTRATASSPHRTGLVFVLGILADECRGQTASWAFSPGVVPPRVAVAETRVVLIERQSPTYSESAVDQPVQPLSPPPRGCGFVVV